MKVLLLVLCLVLVGCENKGEDGVPVVAIDPAPALVSYVGTDMNGDLKQCEQATPGGICTSEYGPGDQFADDCHAQGYKTVTCGCHDYICLQGSESGVDMDGNQRSCDPMDPAIACAAVFTAEDQFAFDCRNSGREAIKCGCSDWICK
jgi:hypothetical protein